MGGLDATVARIASSQHGVVTRRQLLAAGISARAIEKRLDKGSLIGVHRGAYRVGHAAPCVEAGYLAAVLACGDGAALIGRAAAHLLGLIRAVPAPQPEVTAATKKEIAGVETRRLRLDPRDITTWSGIPVTTPARTLVDLAAVVHEGELARAVHQAGIRHGMTPDDVERALARRRNAPGSVALRGVLRGDQGIILSQLERAFLKLLRSEGLPLPITNRLAAGRIVDCRWAHQKVTVELDGYRFHASRHAWEKDRLREREAYARGDQFRRYTWGDVIERPSTVLRELRPILAEALAA